MVSVVPTLVVTVLTGGVEVQVEVWVTVGIERTLLQKGVATSCALMIETMALTAWQLKKVRLSRGEPASMGEPRAPAAKPAARRYFAIALTEKSEGLWLGDTCNDCDCSRCLLTNKKDKARDRRQEILIHLLEVKRKST